MPTSKVDAEKQGVGKRRRMRPSVVVLLALVVILIPVNILLCLVFQPYGGANELVWHDYRKTTDIDTVFVGTSVAANGMNPQALDDVLGTHTYNMATPGQPFHESITAIKTAVRDHGIKRVVMLLGYDTLATAPRFTFSMPFVQAKCLGEPLPEAIGDMADLFLYGEYFKSAPSVLGFFPWAYSHIDLTPSNVMLNIDNRLHCDVEEAGRRYVEKNDPKWTYHGRGFGAYNNSMKAGHEHSDLPGTQVPQSFPEVNMDELGQMCRYCEEQGVELYVFGTPYRPSLMLDYEEVYGRGMAQAQEIIEAAGAHFYDLNMLHRDVYDPKISYFCDPTHLNLEGATQTTTIMGQLIARIEQGEDIRGLFYGLDEGGWQDWRASIDFVDAVDYTCTLDGQHNAVLVATTDAAAGTPVEYQLEVKDPATGEWVVVRAFESAETMTLAAGDAASASIRITAHATNGRQDVDRWVTGTVEF